MRVLVVPQDSANAQPDAQTPLLGPPSPGAAAFGAAGSVGGPGSQLVAVADPLAEGDEDGVGVRLVIPQDMVLQVRPQP